MADTTTINAPAKAAATAASEEMAAKVHAACVALVNEVK